MGEASGNSESLAQRQEETEVQSQFLMESMLTGVVQQLERIERVVEKFNRRDPLKVNRDGEATHTTPDDNFEALKAKLMALSEANKHYQYRFAGGCTNYICEWIQRRQEKPIKSPKIASALIDTLNACEGSYQPAVRRVTLNERTLQELTSRLVYANSMWRVKEAKRARNPEAYTAKQLVQVTQGQQVRTDVDAVRGQLSTVNSTSYGGNPRSFESESRQSGIVEEKVATGNTEEQKQKLNNEAENVRKALLGEFRLLTANVRKAIEPITCHDEVNTRITKFIELVSDYFNMEVEEDQLSDEVKSYQLELRANGENMDWRDYLDWKRSSLQEKHQKMEKNQKNILNQCQSLRQQAISRVSGETGSVEAKGSFPTSESTRATGTSHKFSGTK